MTVRRYNKRDDSKELTKPVFIQLKITNFIKWVPKLKCKYLYRFPRVKIPRFEDFAQGIISKKEWDILRYLPNYEGTFENIFKFNDFSFFDELQEKLEAEGITKYKWLLIISDSGPYDLNILEGVQFKGMIPIIRARKNIKNQPVKELKKRYYFNIDFIPKEWSDEFFLKISSFRPMIEQGNSYNNRYYNASRMNSRGFEAAIKLRATIYILVLLKALTAYKLSRLDLVIKPIAFKKSKYFHFRLLLPFIAE